MSELGTPQLLLPTNFVLDYGKSAGNAHSGHNVVFGSLDGIEVAVKPFGEADGRTLKSRRNNAEHEMLMYKIVERLGYLTLKPKEVIDEHDIAYLITFYTPNLITGTSFDLTRPLEDRSRGKSIIEVVTEIMSETGELHSDEVTHGDAKLRNYAFHRQTGSGPYIVDLEGAQKHTMREPGGYEYFGNLVKNDLRSIIHNMGQNGLAKGACLPDTKDIFDDLLVAPYLSSLTGAPTPSKATIENAYLAFISGVNEHAEIVSGH